MKKQLIDLGCSFDWHRVSMLSSLISYKIINFHCSKFQWGLVPKRLSQKWQKARKGSEKWDY